MSYLHEGIEKCILKKKGKYTHKDKERLRHRNQVRLLNEVMEIVPISPHESQTRIRKLRHLVLYYHFMQMVHEQIAKESTIVTNGRKKCFKRKTAEPIHQSVKVPYETKRKSQRAHIVFLQVDKSKDQKRDIFQESVLNDNTTDYNPKESAFATNSEYQVPEMVVINDLTLNNLYSDHDSTFPLGNPNHTQANSNYSKNSDEYEISPTSSLLNHCEKVFSDSESNLNSEDLFYTRKENHPPVAADCTVMNSDKEVLEASAVHEVERFPLNVVVNDKNLLDSKHERMRFHDISHEYSDFILKDSTIPYAQNESFQIYANAPTQSEKYILNSFETYPFQTASNYPIIVPSEKYQNLILSDNNLYSKSGYSLNSACAEPQFYNSPSFAESVSDNSSSNSTISDKLNIDVENLSDSSNPLCTNFVNSSNPFFVRNKADSPVYCVLDNTQLSAHDLPITSEEIENASILPMFASNNNYFGNNILQSDVSFRPTGNISHSYLGNISHTTNTSFNIKPTIISSESIHSLQDRMVRSMFMSNNDSLYSPYENFQSEELSLILPKMELINSDCFYESLSQENKPAFFDEETSYPLSQYINND